MDQVEEAVSGELAHSIVEATYNRFYNATGAVICQNTYGTVIMIEALVLCVYSDSDANQICDNWIEDKVR